MQMRKLKDRHALLEAHSPKIACREIKFTVPARYFLTFDETQREVILYHFNDCRELKGKSIPAATTG